MLNATLALSLLLVPQVPTPDPLDDARELAVLRELRAEGAWERAHEHWSAWSTAAEQRPATPAWLEAELALWGESLRGALAADEPSEETLGLSGYMILTYIFAT